MFNAWEGVIPSGAKIIHKSRHNCLISKKIHFIIDSHVHRVGFRILEESKFRIPPNPNQPPERPSHAIHLELTLTQCIWRSVVAISEKKSIIQSSLSYCNNEGAITRTVSVPNSGRAFQGAITLYDKQVVLQESLYAGYTPLEENLPEIDIKTKNLIYVFLKFIIVRISSKIQVLVNRILKKRVNWSIGLSPIIDFPPPNPNEIRIADSGKFAADPFLCVVNSKMYVFFETIKKGKGVIECAEVDSQGISNIEIALEENFHLSYPFIFKHEKDIYMLPETSEKQEVRLYKSTTFPTKWTFHKTLIQDILAADSLILHIENEWHLLTNLSSGLVKDFGTELWHYSARDLSQEKWFPNRNNPISMDARISRNAGSFNSGSDFFRCNQVPSFSQYGFGVAINRILQLSNLGYKEIAVEKYAGGFHDEDTGCHHFSLIDGIAAYDFSYECSNLI